jgi:RimJ/RimL family protein N-acetyltransferase
MTEFKPPMDVKPVTLTGRTLRLEPLTMEHAEGLRRAAELSLFTYGVIMPHDMSEAGWLDYMRRFLAIPGRVPFAIVLLENEQPVGTTSYFDIRPEHRGLEIGYTWLGKAYQGTQVNPENKYLLLRHAFETLGAIRVQLKTDGRNLQSQRAMAKLGAKYEGTMRHQVILPDGYRRDNVMFSIIEEEWPEVKAALEARLGYVP